MVQNSWLSVSLRIQVNTIKMSLHDVPCLSKLPWPLGPSHLSLYLLSFSLIDILAVQFPWNTLQSNSGMAGSHAQIYFQASEQICLYCWNLPSPSCTKYQTYSLLFLPCFNFLYRNDRYLINVIFLLPIHTQPHPNISCMKA